MIAAQRRDTTRSKAMIPRELAGVVKDYIDERIKDAFTGRTDVMFAIDWIDA